MPLGERTFERRVWKSSFLHCFTMHISVNRPFDLIIFGLKNAFILANDGFFYTLFFHTHLLLGCPGIAATSWRLSAWKISRSYWQQRRRKGPESRRQIWFERWKRQSWKNPRPGGWKNEFKARCDSNCIHRMLHVVDCTFVYYCHVLGRCRAS